MRVMAINQRAQAVGEAVGLAQECGGSPKGEELGVSARE